MSKRETTEILEDIVESIKRITAYADNMSYDEFMADLKTQDAVIRNIEITGEAAKQLPYNFTLAHSDIPWKAIAGTRDRLIHDYSGVNYDIVWAVIVNDLPSLRERLIEILQSEEIHTNNNLDLRLSKLVCLVRSAKMIQIE
ncbi:HepT-like ribonuclease domain-containing protein [Mesotoga sp. H07.pep.5.3]|uniref:HepT-like ribonuclease domain-containing protein n=1 Tax=Mesotoga sp. H07.pep.5.3 TaxID=1421003 RepID=UPI00211F14A9|nr:DUF86 domain-containing protein [Mesotoga sp. H07.pep.5.3]